MRFSVALFDAPYPATSAVRALRAAGIEPDDIVVAPHLPTDPDCPTGSFLAYAEDLANADRALAAIGVDPDDARTMAEGLRRGAILVVARTPTLTAPVAASALSGALPPDLETHRSRWERNPNLRYGWSETRPPAVDPPAEQ